MKCGLYLLIAEPFLICDSYPEALIGLMRGPLLSLCLSAIHCVCLNTLVISQLKKISPQTQSHQKCVRVTLRRIKKKTFLFGKISQIKPRFEFSSFLSLCLLCFLPCLSVCCITMNQCLPECYLVNLSVPVSTSVCVCSVFLSFID